MTTAKSKRSISAVAIIGLAFLTAMCGERGGAKVKVHPSSPDGKGAAGDDDGSLGAAGEPSAGSGGSSGSGGTSSGNASGGSGGTSEPTAGEGPGSGGSGAAATGGSSDTTGGTDAAAGTTGGTGGTGADSGGTNQTGGTGGASSSGGSASGTAGMGANGGSSAGAAGSGTSGAGGLGVSCEIKTNCCAPDDPPCSVEGGCTGGGEFCCDASVGMRQPCVAGTEFELVACLNCEGVSFGTGACESCLDDADPPCSDPTWDDVCLTGGDALCSDAEHGFRLGCNGVAGGEYYAYLQCTCSAGPTCVPTPCCDGTSPVCETTGCDPDVSGYCCSTTLHYSEVCTDLGDGTVAGQQFICINDCTGQSYGTGSCVDCTLPSDPPCDNTGDWTTACNQTDPVYCSDLDAGYRLRCLEREYTDGSSYPDIELVCACNAPGP